VAGSSLDELLQSIGSIVTPIEPERWNEVWAADLDVLRSLRENGDLPHVVRDVDVSFRGPFEALQRLEVASANWGFRVQELLEADEEGQPWLFLVRNQTTDDEAIRDLTMTYLQMEDSFGVECDGWGCVGQTQE
jgi:regulator of RNase E activity RraB